MDIIYIKIPCKECQIKPGSWNRPGKKSFFNYSSHFFLTRVKLKKMLDILVSVSAKKEMQLFFWQEYLNKTSWNTTQKQNVTDQINELWRCAFLQHNSNEKLFLILQIQIQELENVLTKFLQKLSIPEFLISSPCSTKRNNIAAIIVAISKQYLK